MRVELWESGRVLELWKAFVGALQDVCWSSAKLKK